MTSELGSAISLHRRVAESQEEFETKCVEALVGYIDEKELAQHQLMAYLKQQKNPVVKLKDGRYLKIRTQSSPRVLNEARVATAVDRMTVDQLVKAHTSGQPFYNTVYEVLMDNLRTESFSYNSFPHITKTLTKADKTLAVPRPAPPDIEAQVHIYEEARDSLRQSRAHKKMGVDEYEREKRKYEPIIVEYLHEQKTKKMKLALADDGSCVASSSSTITSNVTKELPPLPRFDSAAVSDVATNISTNSSNSSSTNNSSTNSSSTNVASSSVAPATTKPPVVAATPLPIQIENIQDLEIKSCQRGGKMKKPTFIQFKKAMEPRIQALIMDATASAEGYAHVTTAKFKAALVDAMLDQLGDMTTWVDPKEKIVINA
jgi:hypothetical protein